MARLTKAQREWRPGMTKKRRSTMVMLASTVLGLEAFVAFFAALATFGLKDTAVPPVAILIGGVVLFVALIACCAVLTRPWGPAAGWILQLVLIATGFVQPMMSVIGVLFALAWWYALRTGIRIDRDNAVREKEQAEWEAAHPEQLD